MITQLKTVWIEKTTGFRRVILLRLSIVIVVIVNSSCFFPCMMTARVPPKGINTVNLFYRGTTTQLFSLGISKRSSITDNSEIGVSFCSLGYIPCLFLLDFKHQFMNDTRWWPAAAFDITFGTTFYVPSWIGGRLIISKNLRSIEPYTGFELGLFPYLGGWVGLKVPSETRFSLYGEFDSWFRPLLIDSPYRQDNTVVAGLEYRF